MRLSIADIILKAPLAFSALESKSHCNLQGNRTYLETLKDAIGFLKGVTRFLKVKVGWKEEG